MKMPRKNNLRNKKGQGFLEYAVLASAVIAGAIALLANGGVFQESYNEVVTTQSEDIAVMAGRILGNESGNFPTNCTLPWGGLIESGDSVTAYSTASVACGSVCGSVSQTRTCTNRALSGTYTNGSCSVGACDDCEPTIFGSGGSECKLGKVNHGSTGSGICSEDGVCSYSCDNGNLAEEGNSCTAYPKCPANTFSPGTFSECVVGELSRGEFGGDCTYKGDCSYFCGAGGEGSQLQLVGTSSCTSYVCTGGGVANATSCGNDTPVAADTARTAVSSCEGAGYCTSECHENYTPSGNTCVGAQRETDCSPKPSGTVWNTESSITQTWAGFWNPSATSNYNTEPSTTRCRYKCEPDYHREGSTCVSNTRFGQACSSIPDNASFNTVSSITQTWADGQWTPSTDSEYNTESSSTECRYMCDSEYKEFEGQCVPYICTDPADVTILDNTSLCPGDGSELTADTEKSLVDACTSAKCEYLCDPESYKLEDGRCIPYESCPAGEFESDSNSGSPHGSFLCRVEAGLEHGASGGTCDENHSCSYICNDGTLEEESNYCFAFYCNGHFDGDLTPRNSTFCSDDDVGLEANTNKTVIDTCTDAKCEYRCNAGYHAVDNDRFPCARNSCIGTVNVANSMECEGDRFNITSPRNGNVTATLVSSCTEETKCEWTCKPGFMKSGNACVSSSCNLPWGGSISDGSSVTAYSTSSVACGNTCGDVSETRTCTGGTLSGTYTNQSCSVDVCTRCDSQVFNEGTVSECTVPRLGHEEQGGACTQGSGSCAYDCNDRELSLRHNSCGPYQCVPRIARLMINATICRGDDQDLLAETEKTLVASCTSAKCEYRCDAGFVIQDGACVIQCSTRTCRNSKWSVGSSCSPCEDVEASYEEGDTVCTALILPHDICSGGGDSPIVCPPGQICSKPKLQ